ncbi:MAG: hypothetical protein RIS76_244 [Verrucomicrobiota bacterium]
MYERWSAVLMRWLRVPDRPQPPLGAPGSERIFRSGRNALRLSLTLWAVKQAFALVGLLFGLWFLGEMKGVKRGASSFLAELSARGTENSATEKSGRKKRGAEVPRIFLSRWVQKTPDVAFWLLTVLEGLSVLTYLLLIPVTYALRRLEYEQRWYLVTDRSLRLRSGVWKLQEVTMSFANLQQITVTQGPLQRLLGLSNVRVQSAGGGGGNPAPGAPHGTSENSSHLAVFREVDNGEEIRDLITQRLRQFRESGLGDPEEARRPASLRPSPLVTDDTLAAARELLAEARSLRGAVSEASASVPSSPE